VLLQLTRYTQRAGEFKALVYRSTNVNNTLLGCLPPEVTFQRVAMEDTSPRKSFPLGSQTLNLDDECAAKCECFVEVRDQLVVGMHSWEF